MEQDTRAWWMRRWLLGTRAIQTPQVFEHAEPILVAVNDDDDELWQLIGLTDGGPDGLAAHLSDSVDEDRTLVAVLDLKPGEEAVRAGVGEPWVRRPTR
jgi:hypothetical protein